MTHNPMDYRPTMEEQNARSRDLMGSPARKIKMVCGNCGSDDCGLDATARWSVETQKYELASTFDDGWCDACGGNDVSLEEEEITDG